MEQQKITEVIAERDWLRAALEAVLPIAERYRPKPDLEYAACCELGREALANTSPAPTESVNKELLEALREFVELAREHRAACKASGERPVIDAGRLTRGLAAIAKATDSEKAGA